MAKKDYTLEELEKQYEEVSAAYTSLKEQIELKRQEAEAERQAKLVEEKEAREKIIEAKIEELRILLKDYNEDYGIYRTQTFWSDDTFSSLLNILF